MSEGSVSNSAISVFLSHSTDGDGAVCALLGLEKHLLVLRLDDDPLPGWVEFLGGDRQHLSLMRMPLQEAAKLLATLCNDALAGHLNPGEDIVEILDLPFEAAVRGHRHLQPIRRSGRTSVGPIQIPPCGRDQVVRVSLG